MKSFRPFVIAVVSALVGTVIATVPATAQPAAGIAGRVAPSSGDGAGWTVTAAISGTGHGVGRVVGRTTTTAGGAFRVPVTDLPREWSIVYLTAHAPGSGSTPTFATVFDGVPGQVVLNERTTVATGFALAQFIGPGGIGGRAPGVLNAATMVPNLVDLHTGALGRVLTSAPNGTQTSTLRAFDSLTNMLAACVATSIACDALRSGATTPGWPGPADSFRAFAQIARNPSNNALPLFALSKVRTVFGGGLATAPPAWTLALRFNGGGGMIDGPGNFAIDRRGNLWVNNNYDYTPSSRIPACGSDLLFKFAPNGKMVDGSPFRGGGLSGSGFGIALDRGDNVWVANYGFAAPVPQCPADRQPPHNSVSTFTSDGTPLSPATGFTQGRLDWPQGTAVDRRNNVWMANCGSGRVTVYQGGDPSRARSLDVGLKQAFGVVDNGRYVFVSGMVSNNVAVLRYDGTPVAGSPRSGIFDKPMGVATDQRGNVWVANSGAVSLPCPQRAQQSPKVGSVSLMSPDGRAVAGPFRGGGATLPWGIATDGDGNVWVANFGGKRLSHFCGVDTSTCPPGKSVGAPISPDVTGYYFDGLVRNTGVAVDPSGNVWLANNWKQVPIQANPGGYEIVAFLGLAAPVSVPAPWSMSPR